MLRTPDAPGDELGGWLEAIADPVRLAIVLTLCRVGSATAADLARRAHASSQTLRRHLEALVSRGVITEHEASSDGATPGRPATRFSLPPEVRSSIADLLAPPGGALFS